MNFDIFSAVPFCYISMKSLTKASEFIKTFTILRCEGNRDKLLSKDSVYQTISNKIFCQSNQMTQNWENLENFDICFCVSFFRFSQILIFGEETGHSTGLRQVLSFHLFAIFLWLFGNSRGKLYAKFIMLQYKFCFPCGKITLHGINFNGENLCHWL